MELMIMLKLQAAHLEISMELKVFLYKLMLKQQVLLINELYQNGESLTLTLNGHLTLITEILSLLES